MAWCACCRRKRPPPRAPLLRDDTVAFVQAAENLARTGYVVGTETRLWLSWPGPARFGQVRSCGCVSRMSFQRGHHWLVMPGKRKHRTAPASPPIPVERSSCDSTPSWPCSGGSGVAKIEGASVPRGPRQSQHRGSGDLDAGHHRRVSAVWASRRGYAAQLPVGFVARRASMASPMTASWP